MRSRLALVLAAAALVGVLAMTAPAASSQGWARTDLRPVTQPAPVGGLFVVEVAQRGGLSVVGLDAATGATVWSAPASTSDVTPGVWPNVVVSGGRVIYLGTAGSASALVAADGQTGRPVWTTGPGRFTDMPAVCDDDPSAVCLGGEGSVLRFDIATGRRLAARHVAGLGRQVGDGLYDPGDRDPERIVATRQARVTWSRPLSRIFPERGASTDFGWNFARFDRLGLFVGSVGSKPRRRHGRLILDLASTTAGFRIADGVVRWRASGFYVCSLLPCPGDSRAGYSAPGRTHATIRVGLRTVSRGTVSVSSSRPSTAGTMSRDVRVALEGFALASGRALWRFDAGRDTGLLEQTRVPAQTAANTLLLAAPGGKLVSLNLATGARRPISPTARGWCRKAVTYHQKVGYDSGFGTIHTYIGQFALFMCAARSHQRLATPQTVPAFVGEIGARNAGLIAWSDTTGVIAAPQS